MSGGVILPTPLPVAAAWHVHEWRTVRASAIAEAGIATITLDQLGEGEQWLIDHAVITCSSSTPTTLRLYDTQADELHLLDGSRAGGFDVADWPAGLLVPPGGCLIARWVGASAGARATLGLQLRRMLRAA